jgi:hypothetical protein
MHWGGPLSVGAEIMAETKKLLVAFDPTKREAQSSEFIIPWNNEGRPVFLSLKSGKDYTHGMMVFIGRSISEHDLFAKLVDSGAFIENVNETLACLRKYVDRLQALRIGNVVRIIPGDDESASAFGLELVAMIPSAFRA